jgi:hypothetical protein
MLTETERDCLQRYCALLAARLPDLMVVRMFVEADGVDVWSSR